MGASESFFSTTLEKWGGGVGGRRKGAVLGDGGMNAKRIKIFSLEKNHMQVLFTSTADISCVQMVDEISLHVSTRNFIKGLH